MTSLFFIRIAAPQEALLTVTKKFDFFNFFMNELKIKKICTILILFIKFAVD